MGTLSTTKPKNHSSELGNLKFAGAAIIPIILIIASISILFSSDNPEQQNKEANELEWIVFETVNVRLELSPFSLSKFIPGDTNNSTESHGSSGSDYSEILYTLHSSFSFEAPILDNKKEALWQDQSVRKYEVTPGNSIIKKVNFHLINTETAVFLLFEFFNKYNVIEIFERSYEFSQLGISTEISLSFRLFLKEPLNQNEMTGYINLQSLIEYSDLLRENTGETLSTIQTIENSLKP